MRLILVATSLLLVSCAGTAPSTPSPAVATEAPSSASRVCEAFASGGPVDDARDAAIAALNGENQAGPTRDAIEGFEDLASRASGEEQSDIDALAKAMDEAASSGEGYTGWSGAYDAFFVEYAELCGQEVAP
jgi:hypothetical protein